MHIDHTRIRRERKKRQTRARRGRCQVWKGNPDSDKQSIHSSQCLNFGSKWNFGSHEASHSYCSTISTIKHNDKMGLREFLHVPKIRLRKKSKAGAKLGQLKAQAQLILPSHIPHNQLLIFVSVHQLWQC